MSETAKQLIAAVIELPEAERLAVVDAVFASIPAPAGVLSEDDPDYAATIRRRVEEIKSGKVVGIPGDVFLKRLREKRPA